MTSALRKEFIERDWLGWRTDLGDVGTEHAAVKGDVDLKEVRASRQRRQAGNDTAAVIGQAHRTIEFPAELIDHI